MASVTCAHAVTGTSWSVRGMGWNGGRRMPKFFFADGTIEEHPVRDDAI